MNSREVGSVKEAIAPGFYGFSARSADGREVPMTEFAGKVLLVVNTASKCGFTPQYAGLETLYRQYKGRGLVVLGFPCNQFGGQEPGSNAEISRFCESSYGVSFPLFAKIDVNGPDSHPLYKFLRSQQSGILGVFGLEGIRWNFTKFLVDRGGKVVGRYAPTKSPADLAPEIEKLLGAGAID
jgi:glutathione peroxidase